MKIQHEFTKEEIESLEAAYRQSKNYHYRSRLQAMLLVAEGYKVKECARIIKVDDGTVYRWFEAYRQGGLDKLRPRWGGGREEATDEAFREKLEETVRMRPRALGLPYSMWTLARLSEYMAQETGTKVSYETIRRILKAKDIVFSRPQHKISSPDPEYLVKKKRSKTAENS